MIFAKAKAENGDPIFMIGLVDKNLELLKAGNPIYYPKDELIPGYGLFIYRNDMGSIPAELEAVKNKSDFIIVGLHKGIIKKLRDRASLGISSNATSLPYSIYFFSAKNESEIEAAFKPFIDASTHVNDRR